VVEGLTRRTVSPTQKAPREAGRSISVAGVINAGCYCRARGLLGWSETELAISAGLSLPTVKRYETGGAKVSEDAAAKMVSALEAAGVIFVEENGHSPGVRLRKGQPEGNSAMTLIEFLNAVSLYEKTELWSKGIHVPGQALPRFGFTLVGVDRTGFHLMLDDGKMLGSIQWREGGAHYDPPLQHGRSSGPVDPEHLNQWVSLAYVRSLSAP